jgi:urease subunit alpha
MFGAFGKALHAICATFVSQLSLDKGIVQSYGLQKQVLPVKNCRNVGKKDMVHNDQTPSIEVNPENYEVRVDGQHVTCEPAKELALAQRYFLF